MRRAPRLSSNTEVESAGAKGRQACGSPKNEEFTTLRDTTTSFGPLAIRNDAIWRSPLKTNVFLSARLMHRQRSVKAPSAAWAMGAF
jgi:hypothetical protein